MWSIFGSLARSVAWLFDHWYFGFCLARRSGQFNDWFRIAFCVLAHTNACMHKLSSSYTGEEELISSAWLACDVWPWHRCKWPVVVSVDDWRDWREGKHQSIGTRNHRMIFWSVLSLFSDHKTRLNRFLEKFFSKISIWLQVININWRDHDLWAIKFCYGHIKCAIGLPTRYLFTRFSNWMSHTNSKHIKFNSRWSDKSAVIR